MGHVNNAVFLTYIELARLEYFKQYVPINTPTDIFFILARVEIDFKKPIMLTDKPEVWLWVTKVGHSSWWFEYKIVSAENLEEVFAEAKSVQVTYNYKNKRKEPIPEFFKEILEKDAK
jgi:acyl-CoA thioester hydrolase